jgi:putative endonuclease
MKYYYVYVLKSRIDNKFYTGFTTNLLRRLNEHNSGKTYSTKLRAPLDLIYWEGSLNQRDATDREKYLKTAWGKRYIKNRLKIFLQSK